MARVHWLDVLIAPLTWLARARGRWRLALLLVYAVVLGVVGVLVTREVRFRRLPAVADPVDRRAVGPVNLAEADDGMVLYRRALARLAGPGSVADRERAALDLWLAGTRCPDALPIPPADLAGPAAAEVYRGLNDLWEVAQREATRRQVAGDLDGAWEILRGMIRTGLHAGRHGGARGAATSVSWLWLTERIVAPWAVAPGNTVTRLRGAIADLAGLDALVPPLGETVRIESFGRRAALAREGADPSPATLDRLAPDTDWTNRFAGVPWFRRFWADEPRTSLRLDLALLAGQLAHCDLPAPLDRPLLPRHGVYAVGPRTPLALAAIFPATLAGWADDSYLRERSADFAGMQGARDGVLMLLRRTIPVELAVAAYRLDRAGRWPPWTRDLVGPYLATPPPGRPDIPWTPY